MKCSIAVVMCLMSAAVNAVPTLDIPEALSSLSFLTNPIFNSPAIVAARGVITTEKSTPKGFLPTKIDNRTPVWKENSPVEVGITYVRSVDYDDDQETSVKMKQSYSGLPDWDIAMLELKTDGFPQVAASTQSFTRYFSCATADYIFPADDAYLKLEVENSRAGDIKIETQRFKTDPSNNVAGVMMGSAHRIKCTAQRDEVLPVLAGTSKINQ